MDFRFKLEALTKKILPDNVYQKIKKSLHIPTKGRREANRWLRKRCGDIQGTILSIGSGDDQDGEGFRYRDYFVSANSYTTSEVEKHPETDLVIDARNMPEIGPESYDGIFCCGVLEHVDEYQKAFSEITRILKTGGILMLSVPFRYPPHMEPYDYWRFTEHGIRHMLKDSYEILDFLANDNTIDNFPAAYWVKAKKI